MRQNHQSVQLMLLLVYNSGAVKYGNDALAIQMTNGCALLSK